MTMTSEGGLYRQFGVNAGPLVTTPTLVSGTPQRFYGDRDCIAYVTILGHAGGTYAISIGPTSTPSHAVVTAAALISADVITVPVKLPAGWWLEVTVAGSAAIESCTVITD